MKTIIELAEQYNTDKKMDNGKPSINGLPGHNYAEIYDQYLKDMNIDRMLEIGVARGRSLMMWNEYFDYKAEIHGIDIDINQSKYEFLYPVHLHQGDQKDIQWLNKEFQGMEFDLIIDDGSHRMRDQQISLKTLFPKLKSGGLYVIEDLHTSKIPGFFSNPVNEATTIELLTMLKSTIIRYFNYYITQTDYINLLLNISNIDICETENNYTIGFIRKK